MICANCGRAMTDKVCSYCGSDFRTDEEKEKGKCNHEYDSVIFEELPRSMSGNFLFKCRNCNHITTIRVTRDFIRNMRERGVL